jgi:hypothetical protein
MSGKEVGVFGIYATRLAVENASRTASAVPPISR